MSGALDDLDIRSGRTGEISLVLQKSASGRFRNGASPVKEQADIERS
jgi:hypothetical protein